MINLSDNLISYDVWLGNNRGSVYALRHIKYNTSSPLFWDWSIDEMARYDFPALLNYVLNYTEVQSLSYIAYSQGSMQVPLLPSTPYNNYNNNSLQPITTKAFAGFQLHPEVAPSVNLYIALAPMAFMGCISRYFLLPRKQNFVYSLGVFLIPISSLLLKTLAELRTAELFSLLGYSEFDPSSSEILQGTNTYFFTKK